MYINEKILNFSSEDYKKMTIYYFCIVLGVGS